MIKYVEHRIWFLGHMFSRDGLKKSINYNFNVYGQSNDKIIFEEDNSEIINNLNNIYLEYDLECKKVKFSFLNNGCISIISEYEINLSEKSKFFLKNYDNVGGNEFIKNSKIIFNRLEELIKNDFSSLIILNSNMKWGIPNLLLDEEFSLNDLNINSVMYTQNFIYTKIEEEIFKNEKEHLSIVNEEKFNVFIDWGKRFWEIENEEEFDINLLDSEITYLSKKVMIISQLNIFTFLSQRILYNEELRNKISVEDLELLIASYRTLFQVNELISQDFDEFTNKLASKYFNTDDNINELILSKNDSEITLVQLAKYSESKKFEKFNNIMQGILTTIAILTIYSVVNDIASFLPIEDEKPIQNLRMTILIVITSIIFIGGVYIFKKVKRN